MTAELESACDFWIEWNNKDNSWKELLTNPEIIEAFCRIDGAEARARAWHRRTTEKQHSEHEDEIEKKNRKRVPMWALTRGRATVHSQLLQ